MYSVAICVLIIACIVRSASRPQVLSRLRWKSSFKKKKFLILVHAVSFGEVKAVISLLQRCKQEKQCHIVMTCITKTAYELIQTLECVDQVYVLPFDFPYLMKRWVKSLNPDLCILVETDFWKGLLSALKAHHVPIVLVNGKISLRSYQRFLRFSWLSRSLFPALDVVCVQSNEQAKRFEHLGVSVDRIQVTGNIKLDASIETFDRQSLRQQLGILEDECVITCGSTHSPEERYCLELIQALNLKIKWIIVPRHIQRAAAIYESFNHIIPTMRMSYGETLHNASVLLVDQMGILMRCYAMSDLAFVGGTFVSDIGGHNLIEPCFYSVPVMYGPYIHQQEPLHTLLQTHQAAVQVNSVQEWIDVVKKLVEDKGLRAKYAEGGKTLVSLNQGALQATWKEVDRVGNQWNMR